MVFLNMCMKKWNGRNHPETQMIEVFVDLQSIHRACGNMCCLFQSKNQKQINSVLGQAHVSPQILVIIVLRKYIQASI